MKHISISLKITNANAMIASILQLNKSSVMNFILALPLQAKICLCTHATPITASSGNTNHGQTSSHKGSPSITPTVN